MRKTLFINNREYEKTTVLLEIGNLFLLQRESLLTGTSVSELLNEILQEHYKEKAQ